MLLVSHRLGLLAVSTPRSRSSRGAAVTRSVVQNNPNRSIRARGYWRPLTGSSPHHRPRAVAVLAPTTFALGGFEAWDTKKTTRWSRETIDDEVARCKLDPGLKAPSGFKVYGIIAETDITVLSILTLFLSLRHYNEGACDDNGAGADRLVTEGFYGRGQRDEGSYDDGYGERGGGGGGGGGGDASKPWLEGTTRFQSLIADNIT